MRSGLPGSAAWVSLPVDPIDQFVDPGGRWMSSVLGAAGEPLSQSEVSRDGQRLFAF